VIQPDPFLLSFVFNPFSINLLLPDLSSIGITFLAEQYDKVIQPWLSCVSHPSFGRFHGSFRLIFLLQTFSFPCSILYSIPKLCCGFRFSDRFPPPRTGDQNERINRTEIITRNYEFKILSRKIEHQKKKKKKKKHRMEQMKG
jgi:hypothetical protein